MAVKYLLVYKQFVIENMSEKFLPTQTAIRFSKTDFYKPYQFHGDTNTIRMLYETSLQIES